MIRRVAVIGSGAGGGYAALLLARYGFEIDLFEGRPDHEKACGGGITAKTFEIIPELAELPATPFEVGRLRLKTPMGTTTVADLQPPMRIYNRVDLDGGLRALALKAGAKLHLRHIRRIERRPRGWLIDGEFESDFLVGAGGVSCPVGRLLRGKPDSSDLVLASGYFVPGVFEPLIDVRFYRDLTGYLWWFPRRDHASVGIVWGSGLADRDRALVLLGRYLAENHPEVRTERCVPYAAPCPCYPANTFYSRVYQDDGAALIGDAAGLCDPVTGEGIRHALHSARLLAAALRDGEPKRYYPMLCREILPELEGSARARKLFYSNGFLATSFGLSRRSPTLRDIIARHAVGGIGANESMRAILRNIGRVCLEVLAKSGAEMERK